ncbi:MAG: amidohydrolase [Actinobacteria bacterium]|nr:amidohydrolase [Actinomycetota bacterium]
MSGPAVPTADAVAAVVQRLEPELVALRRDLHAHPEPSWEEVRTTRVLLERLLAAGIAARVAPTGTGVIADVGIGPPRVAIRGDIDALRMDDAKDVPYRSTVDGVCHACGHDLHATATLGAGLALAELLGSTGIGGAVRLLLQPAEETVPGAASRFVEDGVVDGIDVVLGLHSDPSLPVGRVGISAGAITSAADLLAIRLRGPGGHTARPHQSVDLVHVAGRVAVDLPAAMGRLVDPRDGLNLTFGSIRAGEAANVIPSEAELRGSLRSSGRSAWDAAPSLLPRLIASIAEPMGATWELDHQRGAPPIVNDERVAALLAAASADVVGADGVGPTMQSAGGEDFSWYGEVAVLGYLRLGVHRPGAPAVDLHSPVFDIDERAVGIGARILAGAALAALANPNPNPKPTVLA